MIKRIQLRLVFLNFIPVAVITRDKRNIISKITLNRSYNFIVNYISFHLSRLFKRNWHAGMPVSISIEPTTACNLGCPECPSGLKQFTRPTGNLKAETNKQIIDAIAKKGLYVNFYFQGEPFIHPKFLDLVKYAHQKKLYTATSTNAHFLHSDLAKKTVESGLDRLIISIDGVTQETYSSYRVNGELNKVIEGTKNILHWKKELKSQTPHVIFQMLVVKPNEHEIEAAKKLASDLGVNEIRFKTAQVYDYENGNSLIPTNENYSRYTKKANGTYAIKNTLDNQCWRMWQGCVFTWDGSVVPCCFDKDAEHKLGNIGQNNFRSIWKSPVYNDFRKSILNSRKKIDICKNCSEGTKVFAS
ncbi:MAG TPA: radical SAM/SPASM domain-containing protein [Flavobacteriales bacterium]|nr:radical SAM/SPASM domain-containing protein [Flavobacteriales bacterium]